MILDCDGPFATITLDRPEKRNALALDVMVELTDAFRAVGMANGHNPIAVIVPCHRVIGANGSLTGFGGGLERKSTLLELERNTANLTLFD